MASDSSRKNHRGRLDYSADDGLKLSLLGAFDKEPDERHLIPRPVVHGNAHGMNKVTLLRCMGAGSYGGMRGHVHKELYDAPLALLGELFPNEESAQFTDYYADMRYLNEWADLRAITHDFEEDSDKVGIDKSVMPVRLVDCERFTLDVYASVSRTFGFYSTELTQTSRLSFKFKKSTPLAEFWPVLRDTQNLLTLLVGEPVYPEHHYAALPGDKHGTVTIVRHLASSEPTKRLHPHEVVLPLKKMGDNAADRIRQWFEKAEALRPIHNLALGTIYHESLYAEARFLSIVQALESYHRRMKDGKELSPEDHDKRLQAVLDTAPSNYKGWLKGRLRHSNEFGLERRLQTLFSQFPKYSELANRTTPDFVSRVVKTRHYLTHFDETNREGSFTPNQVYFPSEKLRILFWMCMLTEIGYSNVEAERIVMGNNYFHMILQYN